MHLALLQGDNFRLLQGMTIEPHSRLNLFLGPNAAGKTTVLETVHCLSRKRSFRSAQASDLAGEQGKFWRVAGRFAHEGQPATKVQVRWMPGEVRLSSDGDLGLAELSQRFPVQLLEPGQHRLLEDGPAYRRRYLDWGVFHVEPRFYPAWQRYQRALRQRNRALKEGGRSAAAFEPELAEAGMMVHQLRMDYLQNFMAPLGERVRQLLSTEDWSLDLQRGWRGSTEFGECLTQQRDRDRRMGQTTEGPHRAELRLKMGGEAARNRVSRGQQKMLIAALVLAQCDQVLERTGIAPVLLVDDLVAELGTAFQASLIAALNTYAGQVFVSALEMTSAMEGLDVGKVFHVEHGRVVAVS